MEGYNPCIDTYNILLQSALINKSYETAILIKNDIFNTNKSLTNKNNINTDNTITPSLKSSTSTSSTSSSSNHPNEKETQCKVFPNNFTLNILIKGLAVMCNENKNRDFSSELKKMVGEAETNGIKLDIISHNCIINGLVELNRLDDAWSHYEFLKLQTSFEFDVYTYTSLLKAIRKNKSINFNRQIWLERVKEFINAGIILRCDENYSGFICAVSDVLIRLGDIQTAERIFMREKDFFSSECIRNSCECKKCDSYYYKNKYSSEKENSNNSNGSNDDNNNFCPVF